MAMAGFSDRALRAVTIAHDEAIRLGRTCVSVDLLVLGIIDADPDGLAARVLQDVGVDLAALRLQITEPQDRPAGVTSTDAHVPFCADTREVTELAEPEREKLMHDQIDPIHILLALVAGAEARLTELLAPFGVYPRWIRIRVFKVLSN
jgi:ATP-dependent Clp protease ATP-binding subunit ClpC